MLPLRNGPRLRLVPIGGTRQEQGPRQEQGSRQAGPAGCPVNFGVLGGQGFWISFAVGKSNCR